MWKTANDFHRPRTGNHRSKGGVSGDVEGRVISTSSCYSNAVISALVRPVIKIYWCDQQYIFIPGLTAAMYNFYSDVLYVSLFYSDVYIYICAYM